jgi:hypothetical protein
MLEPSTEYYITDVYTLSMRGNPRERGTLRFRTDAQGRVWIQGSGRPEEPYFADWCAKHPRLIRVGKY